MKLLIMQFFFQPPVISFSLRSKYSPQHLVLKHSYSLFSSLNVRDQVLHPYRTIRTLLGFIFQHTIERAGIATGYGLDD
jgi:hypothetical protein